jgi:hypothetical protein
MGRPNKYDTHVKDKLILVEGWARDGLTDEQIAKNLGVAYSTFKEYKKKYSDLSAALKKGKEVSDYEVENALFKSAIGFYYEEDMVTNQGDVVTVRKYQKPNTTAAIFWLKNRRPTKWRDKQEMDVNANVGVQIVDDIELDDEE